MTEKEHLTGTDRIFSTVTFTTPDNVENLSLKGSGDIDATGNSLNNKLRLNRYPRCHSVDKLP